MSQRSPGGTGSTIVATTQFQAPIGSPGTPGYSFTGATTSGWYFTAAPDVRLALNGLYAYLFSATQFLPTATGQNDIGSAGFAWKRLYLDFTNTGTVGSVTINKASGRVNLAAAGTTLTLTNSLITAASKVMLQMASAPGNAVAVSWVAVSAAGSCVITCTPAVTNQTAIDFLVINAD